MSTPEILDKRLESLETTTQTILTEMRKGFTDHDARLGDVGTRLAGIDTRLVDYDTRLASIDNHLVEHDSRLTKIDVKLTSIDDRLADHDALFQRIETTLATLVESVDRFAKIYADLNQEVVVMRQQLRDVESRVGKLELKLKAA